MKKQIELFLLELISRDYNIRWVQGLERRDSTGKEVIKMYDTQSDEILGTIKVEGNSYTGDISDLIREVKYPLLDPETLENHIKGLIKVNPAYNKYQHLLKSREQLIEEVKESRDALLDHLSKSVVVVIDYAEKGRRKEELKLKPGESGRLGRTFNFNPVHVGLMVGEDLWQHDLWTIIIEGQTFDYKTGIGHRECKQPKQIFKDKFNKLMNMRVKEDRESRLNFNTNLMQVSKAVPPTVDDVLYSLLMDSSAEQESFSDWCDNYGFDTDSRKALSMYEQCQANTKKLKTFIGDLEEAQESFQDY